MVASLTTVAITTRRVIRYSVIFLIAFIIFRIVFSFAQKLYIKSHPTPPPAPTLLFGKLPKLAFPENKDLPNFEYKIETPTGNLPKLGEQAKIYFMPSSSPNLFSATNARKKAASLGFTNEPIELSPTVLLFKHQSLPSTLELNTVNLTFSISYDLAADRSILTFRPLPPEVAISRVKEFLAGAGLLLPDLSGPAVHEFLVLEDQKLKTANSLSEAQFIKVNLYRKDYNNLPNIGNNPDQANVWFLVSGSPEAGKKVFAGQYHYFSIDESKSATYPIIITQKAVDELTGGNAYIANLGENSDGKVTIRKIYLAYYDSGIPESFYQPIFVFEGDRNFFAYVPAISRDYYGEEKK
ncbi:hypothetical protein A3D00_01105 [Candidatus Woesebacteria bacterium RIFCSPHIGHO2_02_FULL_38_9]|uniref:Uncharacterized protein n=1 Tax=Candidatus Woesebacteria bacterium RIFCSPHIGHO2_01_FULL_39_28 TaxID=1802496 RepID=A0A1F7YIC3_9BACT|nr:MAG: hypothetical protein A2627_01290 [Candidatus Woesebacteria bacterium RIFCSPHIGHO2_01_FULL_39_28]OGM31721.1 MAG: hypothetical protein A3D00_01105 [Candidatus Woesebacteria bacterium RIFCSPHIGHO2_02_FULL_38_9]OGM57662.1 MAG: hypothetical protein A3A50_01480 [Candidatus Woesebacteria bacterium RIFCSPLOWO2_01_FULL_38_20]